ncbi:hypothetical protein B0H19DRAFT_1257506 [Mycena capillaripes]|nr:hypothetical protein B0H19DRAFT_1257506 [Mycena capillaripes]
MRDDGFGSARPGSRPLAALLGFRLSRAIPAAHLANLAPFPLSSLPATLQRPLRPIQAYPSLGSALCTAAHPQSHRFPLPLPTALQRPSRPIKTHPSLGWVHAPPLLPFWIG